MKNERAKKTSNNFRYTNLTPSDVEFYERVNSMITASNALPFEIPQQAFFDIVVQSLKFFWAWYPYATEEGLYFIPREELENAKKVNGMRNIKLPNGIEAVLDWKSGNSQLGMKMNELLKISLLSSIGGNYSHSSMTGGYGSPNIKSSDVSMSMFEINSFRETFTKGIRASYNKNTQIFKLKTNIPDGLVLECAVRLMPEELYGDYMFERYVIGMVEKQLTRVVSSFDFKLPGDIQINYDNIRSEGSDSVKEITEEIKGMNSNDMIQTK